MILSTPSWLSAYNDLSYVVNAVLLSGLGFRSLMGQIHRGMRKTMYTF